MKTPHTQTRLWVGSNDGKRDEDTHHLGNLSVALQPRAPEVEHADGSTSFHLTHIVEVGVSLTHDNDEVAVEIVTQDGRRFCITVSPTNDGTVERSRARIVPDSDGTRWWDEIE